VVVDHLSRLPTSSRNEGRCDLPIDDSFLNDQFFALAISSVDWCTNLVNYLAFEMVLQILIKGSSSFPKPNHTLGRNLVCTRHTNMVIYCPKRRLVPYFRIAMICLVENKQVVIRPRSRFFKLASTGQPCSRMYILMFVLATIVKGPKIGQG